jgi:hypothetical protein
MCSIIDVADMDMDMVQRELISRGVAVDLAPSNEYQKFVLRKTLGDSRTQVSERSTFCSIMLNSEN